MEATYDAEADAIYLRLAEGTVVSNKVVDDQTILDLDAEENIIGIELLAASDRFSGEELDFRFSAAEKTSV